MKPKYELVKSLTLYFPRIFEQNKKKEEINKSELLIEFINKIYDRLEESKILQDILTTDKNISLKSQSASMKNFQIIELKEKVSKYIEGDTKIFSSLSEIARIGFVLALLEKDEKIVNLLKQIFSLT